jgi:Fibronectin type III domain
VRFAVSQRSGVVMGESSSRAHPRRWAAWLCGVVIVGAGLSGATGGVAAGAAPMTVPGAPKITAATAGLHSVTLSFAKPTVDGGTRITNYRATCKSTNGGVAASHQGFSSPITIIGLTQAKSYLCSVSALNKVGIGPPSAPTNPLVVLPTVPGAPKITKMTPGFHNVSVSFQQTSSGGAPITTYRVTCKDDDGTKSHQAFSSPITIGCVNGAETYTCTVAAENRIGWSQSSPTSAPAISLPVTPGAPKITSVTAGVHSATVAVSEPVNDGGVRITNFRVTCVSSNGGVSGSHQTFNSPITVTGLSSGKTYTCRAFAINKVSTGPASAPSLPVVPLSP